MYLKNCKNPIKVIKIFLNLENNKINKNQLEFKFEKDELMFIKVDEYEYINETNCFINLLKLLKNENLSGDLFKASNFYQVSYSLIDYVFYENQAPFLNENKIEILIEFLPLIQNISPFEINDFNRYMFLYRKVNTELFKLNRLTEFKNMTISMIEHDPNAKWFLINHLYDLVENEEQELILGEIEKQYR